MPSVDENLIVIVDAGLGDSGKGKIAAAWARHFEIKDFGSGATGPNSAQDLAWSGGRSTVFRQLPAPSGGADGITWVGPGTFVDPVRLREEWAFVRSLRPEARCFVDPRCGVVSEEAREVETRAGIGERGASWEEGATGAALLYLLRRAQRAGDLDSLPDGIELMDVPDALSAMPLERQVLIHGTHSPRYSLFSGSTYPAATSAECSVAGVLGRLGVSPRRLKDVVGVVDLVPNTTSEHLALPNELHPQEIERRGWRSHGIVSGLPRRFGLGIDYLNLDDFVRKERPSELALGRADLYDIENSHVRSWCQLGNSVRSLVDELEERYGVPVRAVSTGRLVEDIAFDTGSRGKVLS